MGRVLDSEIVPVIVVHELMQYRDRHHPYGNGLLSACKIEHLDQVASKIVESLIGTPVLLRLWSVHYLDLHLW